MEYGILMAIAAGGTFQIVGAVASRDEAKELIVGYVTFGPECDCLAPSFFEIHRRDSQGLYTEIESIEA